MTYDLMCAIGSETVLAVVITIGVLSLPFGLFILGALARELVRALWKSLTQPRN